MAPVPAGDAFSPRQRDEIERAIDYAERASALPVSVFVGVLDDGRGRAERLHAALPRPSGRVLVAVDPSARQVHIVTGAQVRGRLDDRSCGLAAIAMTSAFSAGDLAGGIANGVRSLAEHARAPRTLHTDLR